MIAAIEHQRRACHAVVDGAQLVVDASLHRAIRIASPDRANIGCEGIEHRWGWLLATEFFDDQIADKGFERPGLRIARYLTGHGEVGDFNRIEAAVAARGAEKAVRNVSGPRARRHAKEEEMRIAAAVDVAARTTQPRLRCLPTEQRRCREQCATAANAQSVARKARRWLFRQERIFGARLCPTQLLERGRRIGARRAETQDQRGERDQLTDDRPSAIQRRSSSTSWQPKPQMLSSLARCALAPAMSPRSSFNSP